jgi:ABC-type phosphate transport system substrate-binding protein
MKRQKENGMKNLRPILIVLIVLAFASSRAVAGAVKVIANPSVSVSAVSSGDLQSVFLLDSDSLGGSHVEPVLVKGGPTHEAFLKEYLGKNDSALQAFYRSLVFTGKASMPKFLDSDAAVVAYVAKTKGAIGYVSDEASTAGVKVLSIK